MTIAMWTETHNATVPEGFAISHKDKEHRANSIARAIRVYCHFIIFV